MTVVANEMPHWMPETSHEEIRKIETKKAKEHFRTSLRDQLLSLRYTRSNKRTWHTLPFFIMYMLSCSYAEIPSIELVKASSRTSFGDITRLMKKITAMLDLGIDLTRSCEITRKEAKLPYLRDFMQRFAQIAKMGEDMISFLTKEYNSFMTMYTSDMERSLTRLRRFTEAYGAILSSSVIIILILVFSSMLWGAGIDLIGIVMPCIIMLYCLFGFVFYVGSPVVKLISLGPKDQKLGSFLRLSKIILRVTVFLNLALVVMLILHVIPTQIGIIATALTGVPALILGFLGMKNASKISELDERLPEFATMLSTSLSTMGTSMMFAFRDIGRLDFGKLSPYIQRMSARLELGIDKNVSWEAFQRETSSELIRIHSKAFADANNYGAMAKEYGPIVGNSALFTITLRRRIEETAALMKGIATPMHPILCAIMGLIMAVITQFSAIFEQFESQSLPVVFINIPPLGAIESYMYVMITSLTIINAFIINEVSGEQEFNMAFYMGLFIVTGWMTYFICLITISGYLAGIGLANISDLGALGI